MTGARRKKIIKVLSGHGDIHYRKLSNPTRIYVDHLDNSGLIGNRMRNRDMRTLVDAVLRSAVKHKSPFHSGIPSKFEGASIDAEFGW